MTGASTERLPVSSAGECAFPLSFALTEQVFFDVTSDQTCKMGFWMMRHVLVDSRRSSPCCRDKSPVMLLPVLPTSKSTSVPDLVLRPWYFYGKDNLSNLSYVPSSLSLAIEAILFLFKSISVRVYTKTLFDCNTG